MPTTVEAVFGCVSLTRARVLNVVVISGWGHLAVMQVANGSVIPNLGVVATRQVWDAVLWGLTSPQPSPIESPSKIERRTEVG